MGKTLFAKGNEPPELQRRMKNLMTKLLSAYPDRIIVSLYKDHKKWAEAVHDIAQKLGYPDNTAFLEDYGFSVEKNAAGRPQNDFSSVIAELKRRYPNGAACSSVSGIMNENPDLKGRLKTMQNRGSELPGGSLRELLLREGILRSGTGKKKCDGAPRSENSDKPGHMRGELEEAIRVLRLRYPEARDCFEPEGRESGPETPSSYAVC